MPTSLPDTDSLLEALHDELRALLTALNDLHHPVYPGKPQLIAELEVRVNEVKSAIATRRSALRTQAA